MYQLEEISYFYILLIIPIMIIGFLFLKTWKKNIQKKYISENLLQFLSPNISNFKPRIKLLFLILFILFSTIALVNPKIGTELKPVKR